MHFNVCSAVCCVLQSKNYVNAQHQMSKWKCVNLWAMTANACFAKISINYISSAYMRWLPSKSALVSPPSRIAGWRKRKEKQFHFWRIATHAACRSSLSLGVRWRRNGYRVTGQTAFIVWDIEPECDTSACGCYDLINGVRCPNTHTDTHRKHVGDKWRAQHRSTHGTQPADRQRCAMNLWFINLPQ